MDADTAGATTTSTVMSGTVTAGTSEVADTIASTFRSPASMAVRSKVYTAVQVIVVATGRSAGKVKAAVLTASTQENGPSAVETLVIASVSSLGVMVTARNFTLPVLLTTTLYVMDSPADKEQQCIAV
jgi:long-subunit fatty acid transport protein